MIGSLLLLLRAMLAQTAALLTLVPSSGSDETRRSRNVLASGALLAQHSDAALLLDDRQRIVAANARAAELLDNGVFQQGTLLADVAPALVPLLASSRPQQIALQLPQPDGTSIPCTVTITPLSDGTTDADGWLIVLRDLRPAQELELLKQQSTLLDEISRVAQIGGWEYEPATGEVRWTDELYRIHELPPDTTPTLELLLAHYPPEAQATLRSAITRLIATGDGYDLELPFVMARANAGWVRVQGAALRTDDGTLRLYSTLQDITARKTAELALQGREREARALLQRLFDHLPVMVGLFDPQGRLQWNNQAWEATLGWSSAEMQQHPDPLALFYPEPGYRAEVAAYIQAAQGSWGDFRTTLRDGRLLDTAWANVTLDDGAIIGIGLDITRRKAAERALQASEVRARTLMEQAPIAMAVARDGMILEVNAAFLQLFALTDSVQAVGQSILDFVAPEEQAVVAERIARRSSGQGEQAPQTYTTVGQRADGRTVPIQIHIAPVELPDGPAYLGFVLDLTASQQAEADRLAIARQRLELEKLEGLTHMAGGIAHDFNNLLTVILGNVELLVTEGLSPDAREAASEVRQAGERASALTRQMLAFSGGGHFLPQRLDLGAWLIEQSLSLLARVPPHIRLQHVVSPQPLPVVADVAQLAQLLHELVANAVEAIGPAPGTITIELALRQVDQETFAAAYLAPNLPAGLYVTLTVADDGPGIDPGVRARIFEPFVSTRFTGRGVGLAAVWGIVRDHRGAILVESTLGQGTRLSVLLPLTAPRETSRAALPPAVAAEPSVAGPVVLVVDDEAVLRTFLARALERAGYAVVLADDGSTAIDLLMTQGERIALALVDLAMPELSGTDIVEALHNIRPDLPILLMSGSPLYELERRVERLPVVGLLPKPFAVADLLRAVREATTGRSGPYPAS
jgi:two-component system, cell cycle sensor histidine kinase and response regulator CckA